MNIFSRRRRPWRLLFMLVFFAANWFYKTYIAPRKSIRVTNAPREYSRKETPRTSSQSQTVPSMPMESGAMISDTVIKVSDGDTVKLQKTGTVRLIGVDCPELHFQGKAQPGGEEAGDFTRRTLLYQDVQVQLCEKQPNDRYGRALGFIYLPGRDGKSVLFNRELVRAGYARVLSLRPCNIDEDEWNALYEEARRARRGLFARMEEVPDAAAFRRTER